MTAATTGTGRGKLRRRWRARGSTNGASSRLPSLGMALIVGALIAALFDGFGAGQNWWSYETGLAILTVILLVLLAGTSIAFFARLGRRGSKALSTAALVLGLLGTIYLGNFWRTARSVPAIHDVTTDLEDTPQFRVLKVRADNLANVPVTNRPGWSQLPPLERWRAIHSESYPDIDPVILDLPPAAAFAKVEALVRARGWKVAHSEPGDGQIEATASTPIFAFKDDVVIRVRPAGRGSRVDIRSVSRAGVSDLGANATRIRAFGADLKTNGRLLIP